MSFRKNESGAISTDVVMLAAGLVSLSGALVMALETDSEADVQRLQARLANGEVYTAPSQQAHDVDLNMIMTTQGQR